MSDDARFDPRFDPAFQPGYDGPLGAAAVAPTPPVIQAPQWSADAAPAPRAPLPAAPSPAAPLEPRSDEDPAPTTNPLVLVLAAVAALLTGGGAYLLSRLRDLYADAQTSASFDYVTIQALIIGAPMIMVLGIATGIGVLFLFAARWRR